MKIIKPGLQLFVCLLILSSFYSVNAQIKKGELTKNQPLTEEIKEDEKHQFVLRLDENQFAFIKLEQMGVDLMITTYDPGGQKIRDFDSPNGSNGTEFISFISDKKGLYRIEVFPLERKATGKYSIQIEKIVPKANSLEGEVDQLFAPWDRKGTPGATVSVVKNGKIVYKKGFGMANLEYDIPNAPDTIFHIASVSKQFTTFSILLLEKDGKLSLDDDIRKHIPEVPDFGKTITLRHLAHHTSGLRDQWALIAMAGGRLDDVITKEHIFKLISRQKELNFEPGSEYLYSNTGYTLLAEVVARVSGKSFADFTNERIFQPLKMRNTLFYDDHEKIVKNRAYSYRPSENSYKKLVLSYANVGATSLFTTVEDLSLWAINFENPIVGDRTLMKKMAQQGVLNNGQTINYALGQAVGKYQGLDRISHSGGDAGYRTYLARFPEQKFSVMVLSNDGSFNSGLMAQEVTDIFLRDVFPKSNTPTSKSDETPNAPEKEIKSIEVDPKTLQSYVGTYQLQPGFLITITETNGTLFAQATGQPKIDLIALSPGKFKVQIIDAEITFHPDKENKITLLKLYQGGNIQDAKRVPPFDPKAVDLTEFTGSFYSEELAAEYKFSVKDGNLTAIHSRLEDIVLRPAGPDLFVANTWFFQRIKFIRDKEGVITGLEVSNGRVRNLDFKKNVQ